MQGISRDGPQVSRIIAALEEPACPDIDDIVFMQDSLRQLLASPSRPEPPSPARRDGAPVRPTTRSKPLVAVAAVTRGRVSMVSTLDSQRFSEAKFYLETYGTGDMLLAFFMRHGFLLQACETALRAGCSPTVLVRLPSACNPCPHDCGIGWDMLALSVHPASTLTVRPFWSAFSCRVSAAAGCRSCWRRCGRSAQSPTHGLPFCSRRASAHRRTRIRTCSTPSRSPYSAQLRNYLLLRTFFFFFVNSL